MSRSPSRSPVVSGASSSLSEYSRVDSTPGESTAAKVGSPPSPVRPDRGVAPELKCKLIGSVSIGGKGDGASNGTNIIGDAGRSPVSSERKAGLVGERIPPVAAVTAAAVARGERTCVGVVDAGDGVAARTESVGLSESENVPTT